MKRIVVLLVLALFLFASTAYCLNTPKLYKRGRVVGLSGYTTKWGGKWVAVEVDGTTNALKTIGYEHAETHSGSGYTTSFPNTVTNIGEMTGIAFNTADTAKWCHVVAVYSSQASARFGIYRAPSIDVDEGTDSPIYNQNENSTNTSGVSTIETVPEANECTTFNEAQAAAANITKTIEIMPAELAAGSGPRTQGGAGAGRAELILRRNTQYIFLLTATSDDTSIQNITLFWYEHTNRK